MANDDDYAVVNISYDMSETNPDTLFLALCSNIRNLDRSKKMSNHPLDRKGLVNLDFYPNFTAVNNQTRTVRLKMRNDSFYILGFQQRAGEPLWEALDKDKKKLLKDSTPLPFTSSYSGKSILGTEVSFPAFKKAISTLGTSDPGTKDFKQNEIIKKAFFTVVVFVAEGSRFRWISHFIATTFVKDIPDKVQDWYMYLANNWKAVSTLVNTYKKEKPDVKLPIPFADLTKKDIEGIEEHVIESLFNEGGTRRAAVCLMISLFFTKATNDEDAVGPLRGRGGPKRGRGGPQGGRGEQNAADDQA